MSDVSPRTDLESTLLCVGAFFVLWLTYRHFVAFLNSSLVRGKISDYAESAAILGGAIATTIGGSNSTACYLA